MKQNVDALLNELAAVRVSLKNLYRDAEGYDYPDRTWAQVDLGHADESLKRAEMCVRRVFQTKVGK